MSLLRVPFLEAVEDATGGNPKLQTGDYQSVGRFPIVDQGQEFIAGYTDDEGVLCNRTGDVIVFGDHTKAFKFINFDFVLGADGVKVLRPKSGFDARYLFHYLQTVRLPENLGYSRHFKYLKECVVPKPSLEEQKRIAAILDKADSLRRKRQQAIRLSDDFLRAIFLDMFGDPVTNPKGWPVKDLRSVVTKITDGTHKSPPMATSGIPYVTAKHIKKEGVRFDLAPTYISESDHREIFSRCDPGLGDVLYIKDGATTGIACQNNMLGEFSLLSSVALIRPCQNWLSSEYLVELLNNDKFKAALIGDMAGAAIKRFTLAKIGNFKLPIPSVEQQGEFSKIAEKIKTLQIKLREEMKEAQALFLALQSQSF